MIHRSFAATAALLLAGACTPVPPSSAPAPARDPLAAALDSIFDDTLFASAHWGVEVRSLKTGRTIYAREPGKMVVPASNMKLVTAAAALEALGPDYRYRTRVATAGTVRGGVLQGDLIVFGSGDPTISERFFGDVRTTFSAWADSLRAHGIQRISGDVIGNDDVFDDVPLGRGWAWDDVEGSYSAEVGGLELNEGFVTVRVEAGSDGPRVTSHPVAPRWVPIESAVTLGAPGSQPSVAIHHGDSVSAIVVSGALPADAPAVEEEISVRDNTRFFADALRQALVDAGIRVDGGALDADDTAREDPAAATTIFTHTSPPLRDILPGFLKPSQNQIGEMLLKTLGHELRGTGTAGAGLAVVDSMVRLWRLPRPLLSQADGSGLSRYNLVAPAFLVALLEAESRSPNAQVFFDALPVAGVDGTLETRMRGTPAQGTVHAKTGTLSGVRSLSGHLTTAAGERLVFSIIVNNHTRSARDADRVAEAAVLRLIALTRRTSTAP